MTERELFIAALDIEDMAARQSFLTQSCAGDSQLRKRVEALLASLETGGEFMQTPVMEQLGECEVSELNTTILLGAGSTVEKSPLTEITIASDLTGAIGSEDQLSEDIPAECLTTATRPDSLGRLAHYEILERLGRGAFGAVFRAFDEKLHRIVAVKVLAPVLANSLVARQRFLQEARAAAKIRHENVVAIYAVEEQPLPFLVIEYIPGRSLQQRVEQQGPISVSEVVRLGAQIARGLAAAHAEGLIHRDVKPGNILLETGAGDRVKITDFGLACAADEVNLSQNGVIAGTPMYMAPEQAIGQKLDQRADLFSFGSVLYQMLSGNPPFTGNSSFGVLKRVARAKSRPIQEVVPKTPAWLGEMISRLHSRNPEERYQSASEVAALLADRQVHSLPAEAQADAGRMPEMSQSSALPPRSRFGRWAIAFGVLTMLIASEVMGVTNFSGSVIRLFTPEGTLIVEVEDPDVKVIIDGGTLSIQGPGIKEFQLKTGRHALQAHKRGKFIRQELVNIAQDGRRLVRIRLEPPNSDDDAVEEAVELDAAAMERRKAENAAWEESVAGLPASELMKAISIRMQELNPKFNGELTTRIENGVVKGLEFEADAVTDISPVRALKQLESLVCRGSDAFSGHRVDEVKSGDHGSANLRVRTVGRSRLSDLNPLAGLPLKSLQVVNSHVCDLSPLKGMALTLLNCDATQIEDLSPLRGMPLQAFYCSYSRVTDLSPLEGLPLTMVMFVETRVSDLSPLRGMKLTQLGIGREVSDLAPLAGMPLVELDCRYAPITDLAPLAGMPLSILSVDCPKLVDVTPLQQVKSLKRLWCGDAIADLSPLVGLQLEFLRAGPRVADLSPLSEMPLTKFEFHTFRNERDGKVLREIKTLKLINDLPVAEFWKSIESNSANTKSGE